MANASNDSTQLERVHRRIVACSAHPAVIGPRDLLAPAMLER
jgi:hypothetical protein